MTMTNGVSQDQTAKAALPALKLPSDERDRLANLAAAALDRFPEAAGMLLDEVERADVLANDEPADGIVCMYSNVTFIDEGDGSRREVQLVYPGEADISANRISVLSLVGAALIGLSAGQSILCPTRGGKSRLLTVVHVRD
jgi:regulator of nucleoside diphosphate kinase